MSKRIFPNWEKISSFKNPLSEEFLAFIQYLDENLLKCIEIYVRPHINGDQPDLCILNPIKGLMIYNEIRWQYAEVEMEIKQKKVFDRFSQTSRMTDMRIFTKKTNKGKEPIADPVSLSNNYCDDLVNIYVPEIGKKLGTRVTKNVHCGLLLPYMKTSQAQSTIRVALGKCNVIGSDYKEIGIDSDSTKNRFIVPYLNRSGAWNEWNEAWRSKLRFFLIPPLHKIEDGIFIKLTDEQQRNTEHTPQKHTRLRGAAGSGKSLLVAQRAANIAHRDKTVLILTFNITLIHYIFQHLKNVQVPFNFENISIKHFHGFCRNFLKENGIPWPISDKSENEDESNFRLTKIVPELVTNAIKSGINSKNRSYDAIIIDEGQDFDLSWYNCVCEFLTTNDELLFVIDEKQNLYKRNNKWIDKMSGGGKFNKRWRELSRSYRFPKIITKKVNAFAREFLPQLKDNLIDEDHDLTLFNPKLLWCNYNEVTNNDIYNVILNLVENHNLHPEDIVVLMPTHESGNKAAEYLRKQFRYKKMKFTINDIFEKKGGSNIKKYAFHMDEPGLKMSTINSFKGWELLTVVLITPHKDSSFKGTIDQLVYTGITRARSNLIVLNQYEKYYDFGTNWPTELKKIG